MRTVNLKIIFLSTLHNAAVDFCDEEGRVSCVNYIACVASHHRRERHERVLLHSLWLYDKLKQFLCYTTLLQLKFLILESVHQGLHVVSDRNFLSACGIFDWNFKDRTLRCEEGSEPRCAGQSVTELGVCSVTGKQWDGAKRGQSLARGRFICKYC